MSKSLKFLEQIFLIDEDGEKAKIISARGAEGGLDHLELCTQTETQAEAGLKSMFRIFVSEEPVEALSGSSTNHQIEIDRLTRALKTIEFDLGIQSEAVKTDLIRRTVEKALNTPIHFLKWNHPEFSSALYTEITSKRSDIANDYLGRSDEEALAAFEVEVVTMTRNEFENLPEFQEEA